MAEYTHSDVIVSPDDPRVKIGDEYYFGDNVGALLHGARTGWSTGVLCDVGKVTDEYSPFYNGMSGFSCIIRKKESSYVERQTKWLADNGIKVGDKVRVVRKAESLEDGWQTVWNPDMDEAVGKVGTVSYIPPSFRECGIEVDVPGVGRFYYPYFVLKKAEPEYEPYDFSDLDCRTSLLGKAVKFMDGSRLGPALITGFELFDDGVWGVHVGGVSTMDAIALLDGWVFLDGTPCGIEVEDEEVHHDA